MVNAFSDYAKPSQMQPQPVRLDPLVGEVLELYQGLPVPLQFHRNAPEVEIDADPVRLRQVLHNLLKNAEEAVTGQPDGRVEVQTLTGQQNDCQYAEIQVVDNGPGFDSAQLDRVFDPYVTSKDRGTGLGLAIVKKIIDEHGGAIWAENRPEGGARVVIRLPALSDPATRASCDKLAGTSPRRHSA
jgi:nitrogen fixation/metabolism regulation signal transduction histidine kinase